MQRVSIFIRFSTARELLIMTPPLNEVTLLSPEIELSEIWGDIIVALFSDSGISLGWQYWRPFQDQSVDLVYVYPSNTAQNRKIFARLRRDFTLLKWSNSKIFARLRRKRVHVMIIKYSDHFAPQARKFWRFWSRILIRNDANCTQNSNFSGRRRRP